MASNLVITIAILLAVGGNVSKCAIVSIVMINAKRVPTIAWWPFVKL